MRNRMENETKLELSSSVVNLVSFGVRGGKDTSGDLSYTKKENHYL